MSSDLSKKIIPPTLPQLGISRFLYQSIYDGLCHYVRRHYGKADIQPMSRGKSNLVWLIKQSHQTLIAKVYLPKNRTPLFANCPQAEMIALAHFNASGISPKKSDTTQLGHLDTIFYPFIEGHECTAAGVKDAARGLRIIHKLGRQPKLMKAIKDCAPEQPKVNDGLANYLMRQCIDMIAQLPKDMAAVAYLARPHTEKLNDLDNVMAEYGVIHGDAVPSNMIYNPKEIDNPLVFIDWQAVKIGHPIEDIALFLSPAMRSVYGHRPLKQKCYEFFAQAYGDAELFDLYKRYALLFHWRMLLYCFWRILQGKVSYVQGAKYELEALKRSMTVKQQFLINDACAHIVKTR